MVLQTVDLGPQNQVVIGQLFGRLFNEGELGGNIGIHKDDVFKACLGDPFFKGAADPFGRQSKKT